MDGLLTLNFTEKGWTNFCRDFGVSHYWFLMHYNAPSHYTSIVKQFLANKSVTVLYNPPYQIWHLQTKVKSNLKGHCYDTISDTQNNAMKNK
jgi:hypothetical protein